MSLGLRIEKSKQTNEQNLRHCETKSKCLTHALGCKSGSEKRNNEQTYTVKMTKSHEYKYKNLKMTRRIGLHRFPNFINVLSLYI